MPQRGRKSQRSTAPAAKGTSSIAPTSPAPPNPKTPRNDEEGRRILESSEKRYFRIGEVSKLTGVKAHVLRYWETEFRWMAPPKSRSKQRLYRKRDIELVWLLKRLLWEQRYTIAGARQRIQELGLEEALALVQLQPDEAGRAQNDRSPRHGSTDGGEPVEPPSEPAASIDAEGLGIELDQLHDELLSLRGLLRDSV